MASGAQATPGQPAQQNVGRVPQTTTGVPPGGPFIRYSPTTGIQGAGSRVLSGLAFGSTPSIQLTGLSGFLKGIWLKVQATGGTSTAAVVAAADAPYNIIQSLNLRDQSGQPIIQPIDGFALFAYQLYSGMVGNGGSQDPRVIPSFSAVQTASGAGAGNFTFKFYLPCAANSSGYCALPSDNSAELPQLQIQLNTSGSVYTTAPGTLPTITLTIEEDYYGIPQNYPDAAPYDVGASAQIFNTQSAQNPPSGAYQRILDQAVGQFIHSKILIFRDGNNVRQDVFPTSDLSLFIDNFPYRYELNDDRYDLMARAFGVGTSVFQPRPTGVIAYTWRQSIRQEVDDSDDFERLLVTTGSTKFEVGGTWGTFTGVGQLQTITGMIFPGPSGWPYGSQGGSVG